MHPRLPAVLRWTVPVLVAGAFALALIAEDMQPTADRELMLHWHQRLGLLALVVLLAAIVAERRTARSRKGTSRDLVDRLVEAALAILLLLQPLAGWLLASAEGRLTSVLGWPLPPLLAANPAAVEYVLIWHGLQSAVILLLAALHIRLRAISAMMTIRRPRRRTSRREP